MKQIEFPVRYDQNYCNIVDADEDIVLNLYDEFDDSCRSDYVRNEYDAKHVGQFIADAMNEKHKRERSQNPNRKRKVMGGDANTMREFEKRKAISKKAQDQREKPKWRPRVGEWAFIEIAGKPRKGKVITISTKTDGLYYCKFSGPFGRIHCKLSELRPIERKE